MDDFDAMEDLETFKTNFPRQTNPLSEALKRVFAWFAIFAIGFSACVFFHAFAEWLAQWLK